MLSGIGLRSFIRTIWFNHFDYIVWVFKSCLFPLWFCIFVLVGGSEIFHYVRWTTLGIAWNAWNTPAFLVHAIMMMLAITMIPLGAWVYWQCETGLTMTSSKIHKVFAMWLGLLCDSIGIEVSNLARSNNGFVALLEDFAVGLSFSVVEGVNTISCIISVLQDKYMQSKLQEHKNQPKLEYLVDFIWFGNP